MAIPGVLAPDGPEQLKALATLLMGTTVKANYCVAASTAWLLYDLAITFEEEVELIWRSRNTPPKLLYFTSRYLGVFTQLCLVGNLFPMYCPNRLVFTTVTCSILGISVQLGLMLRVYAVWGRSRTVGIFLILGFLISEAAGVSMLYFGYRVIIPGLILVPGMPITMCVVTAFPHFYNLCWLPTLCFELFLFVMNVLSCWRYRPFENTPTITRLFRDGSVYFAGVCLILAISTIGAYIPSSGLTEYVESLIPAMFSFSGSHLLLSIRRLAVERRKRMEFSGISTCIVATVQKAASQLESAGPGIELEPLDATAPQAPDSGTPGTQGGEAKVDVDGDVDVESGVGRVRHGARGAGLAHVRELPSARAAGGEGRHDGDADVEVSPAESGSPPPLVLERFLGKRILDRLARLWDLDWLTDWEHQ